MLGRAATTVSFVMLAACSNEDPEEISPDASSAETRPAYGLISIERSENADGSTRSNVSAKFMRITHSANTSAADGIAMGRERAEDLVGGLPLLPALRDCASLAALETAAGQERKQRPLVDAAGSDDFSVELLDVGDLSLLVRDGDASLSHALAVRAFPDVGDLASGVFYTSIDASEALPSPAHFEFGGTGAPQVDPFVLEVSSPRAPGHLQLSHLKLGEEPRLSWDAASETETSVYVDVRGSEAYRCSFPDTGAAILPAALLTRDDLDKEIVISLHRISDRSFTLPSPARSELASDVRVRFDQSTTLRARVF